MVTGFHEGSAVKCLGLGLAVSFCLIVWVKACHKPVQFKGKLISSLERGTSKHTQGGEAEVATGSVAAIVTKL